MSVDSHSDKRNPSASLPAYIQLEAGNGVSLADLEALDDQDLLRLVAQRSRQALEVLYARYSGPVYSLAVHMLRDSGAAEEVTQDAFFNVWRRASSFRPERGKVTAWLFSIAHHRVIDEVRRRRRRDQTQVFHDVDLLNQPADDTGDPVMYAMLQMKRGILKEALDILRPEQREVVVLAYYGGLTHSEISRRLEQPLGTVKTRMRLALKKLREHLGQHSRQRVEHGL